MKILTIFFSICVWQYQLISINGLLREKRATAIQIKGRIEAINSWEVIGLGGRYGAMQDSVSKKDIIESDHFPPKNTYRYARDRHIQRISERNMAAVSLRHDHHRQFITTGYSPQAQQTLRRLFTAGNYYEAISLNIQWYKDNPDRQGQARDRFDHYIKQGIKDALEIHVTNGLITQAQRQQLIRTHQLDVKHPTFNVILNSELRDDAREYLLNDVRRYG